MREQFSKPEEFNESVGDWVKQAMDRGLYMQANALRDLMDGEEWVSTGVGDMPFFAEEDSFVDFLRIDQLPVAVRDEHKHTSIAAIGVLFSMAKNETVNMSRSGFIVPDTGMMYGEELKAKFRSAGYWQTAGCSFDLSPLQDISALRAVLSIVQAVTGSPDKPVKTLTVPKVGVDGVVQDIQTVYSLETDLTGGYTLTEYFRPTDIPATDRMRSRAMIADHAPILGDYGFSLAISE